MSHVDEGSLHAYLDGELDAIQPGAVAALEAHLASCDECRVRLDDERRIRDRARAVLDHAAPANLEVPPFDAVLERARGAASTGGGSASAPSRRTFTVPLAWAASIALALVGGWWARDMALRNPTGVAIRETQAEVEAFSEAASTEAAPAPRPAGEAAGAAAPPATRPAAPAPAADAAATSRALRDDDAPIAPASADRLAAVRDSAAIEARRRVAGAPAQVAVTGGAAPQAAPAAEGAVLAAKVADVAPAELAWAVVERSEAERRLGGRLMLVEGLDVASIEVADSAGTPHVRTRQTVAPGVQLVLLQRRVSVTPARHLGQERAEATDEPPARAEAPAELSIERDGFLLTLRAGLPPDSLRALAGRLR